MFVENLAPFFADFADTVQVGDQSGPAIINAPDHDVLGGRASSTAYAMTYVSALFPYLAHGDQVTVLTGRYVGNYSVIVPNKLDDGATSIATLQRMP